MARKETKLYTVRNSTGQYLASYFAQSPADAIAALVRDQNIHAATFTRGAVRIDPATLTASAED